MEAGARTRLLAVAGLLFAAAFNVLAPAMASTQAVTISDTPQGGAYSPPTVTIAQDDTVSWSYAAGATQHTVTARPGQALSFDSGLLSPGGTFNKVFHLNKPAGTYSVTYYCKIHGSSSGPCNMCGSVTVSVPSTPPPTLTPIPTKKPTPAPTAAHTAAPTPVPTATHHHFFTAAPVFSTSPSPTPTESAVPTSTQDVGGLVQPSFSPLSSDIAFGQPKKSDHGALVGIAVAAAGIAIGGAIIVWYRVRGPA